MPQPCAARSNTPATCSIGHPGVWCSRWGIQLMTAALGGKGLPQSNGREFGVARNITLNESAASIDDRGKPVAFPTRLCSHEDEVGALPACGRLLASNTVSRVQAAEYGRRRQLLRACSITPSSSSRFSPRCSLPASPAR